MTELAFSLYAKFVKYTLPAQFNITFNITINITCLQIFLSIRIVTVLVELLWVHSGQYHSSIGTVVIGGVKHSI